MTTHRPIDQYTDIDAPSLGLDVVMQRYPVSSTETFIGYGPWGRNHTEVYESMEWLMDWAMRIVEKHPSVAYQPGYALLTEELVEQAYRNLPHTPEAFTIRGAVAVKTLLEQDIQMILRKVAPRVLVAPAATDLQTVLLSPRS